MKFIRGLASDSSGVTGLETAVVLLSFFVVASVLGLSVVKIGQSTSTGNAQILGKQLTDSLPVVKPKGSIMGIRSGDGEAARFHLSTIVIPIMTYSDETIQLSHASFVVSYYDRSQYANDLPWTARWVRGDGDNDVMEVDELVEISVDISSLDPKLAENTSFTLEFKPLKGRTTRLKPSSPGRLDSLTVLSY